MDAIIYSVLSNLRGEKMDYNLQDKHIGIFIKNIHQKAVNSLNKELEAFDITLMQNEVLGYISFHQAKGDVFQKQIEEYFKCSNPTITGILKRLEAKGLIKRDPSLVDARYKKLTLTDKGYEVSQQALEIGPNKLEVRLTNKLSNKEIEELKRLLNLVLEGLED